MEARRRLKAEKESRVLFLHSSKMIKEHCQYGDILLQINVKNIDVQHHHLQQRHLSILSEYVVKGEDSIVANCLSRPADTLTFDLLTSQHYTFFSTCKEHNEPYLRPPQIPTTLHWQSYLLDKSRTSHENHKIFTTLVTETYNFDVLILYFLQFRNALQGQAALISKLHPVMNEDIYKRKRPRSWDDATIKV